MAYKPKLPSDSLIHPTFHVSKLKRSVKQGTPVSLILVGNVAEKVILVCVLGRLMAKRGSRAVTKVLVQWSNGGLEEATWKYLFDLEKKFLNHTLDY